MTIHNHVDQNNMETQNMLIFAIYAPGKNTVIEVEYGVQSKQLIDNTL